MVLRRRLPPMFDSELSTDEALNLYRRAVVDGGAGEAQFLCMREMSQHIEEQNGNFTRLTETVVNHLTSHPVNERVTQHLQDTHDNDQQELGRRRLLDSTGTAGNKMLAIMMAICTLALAALQRFG
jgi:hypothetical protein